MAGEQGGLEAKGATPKQSHVVQVIHHEEAHTGPLPAPSTMAEYERLLPGTADRIMRMAESEQGFRHDVIRHAFSVDHEQMRFARRGQWWAGALIVFAAVFAGACIWAGSPATGGWLLGTVTTVLGAVMITGKATGAPTKTKQPAAATDSPAPPAAPPNRIAS